jgi:hypothetical protein
MMSVEQSVKWELEDETEVLRENLLQCHFVLQIFHMAWNGTEPRAAMVGLSTEL